MKHKSYWVLLCLLAMMLLFPMALPSSFSVDMNSIQLFSALPLTVNEWRGRDVPVDERTYEILETRNVLSREYQNAEGKKIHLLIVASQKDRRVAHPPEVCYLSSNFHILDEKEGRTVFQGKGIPFREFVAQNEKDPRHNENVLYVYKVGERFTANYFDQQVQFAWDRIARRSSQVLLIRLSSAEKELFEQFLSEILPHLNQRS